MIRAMPDASPFGDVRPVSSREWEDPKIVQLTEVPAYMEEGWEPCGPVMMSAINQQTGQKANVLCWGIKRKYSALRESIERTSKLAQARAALPPINGRKVG